MGKRQYVGRPGRPKKRKFHGNQCAKLSSEITKIVVAEDSSVLPEDRDDAEVQQSNSGESETSSDSDSNSSGDERDGDDYLTTGSRIIYLECLQNLLADSACCSACHGTLTLCEVRREGLASTLSLACDSCEAESREAMSKKTGHCWDVNRKPATAMTWIGRGHPL
eukprot:scpid68610/ scgid23166/ 